MVKPSTNGMWGEGSVQAVRNTRRVQSRQSQSALKPYNLRTSGLAEQGLGKLRFHRRSNSDYAGGFRDALSRLFLFAGAKRDLSNAHRLIQMVTLDRLDSQVGQSSVAPR